MLAEQALTPKRHWGFRHFFRCGHQLSSSAISSTRSDADLKDNIIDVTLTAIINDRIPDNDVSGMSSL
jgi:hypothetical protein